MKKGFSLIELLVVIVIISVLATIVGVSSFRLTKKSVRDGKRKADIHAIRSALEMYKADEGSYPGGTWQTDLSGYMTIPTDPGGSFCGYTYYGGSGKICACLEVDDDPEGGAAPTNEYCKQ
jgi:prepilin-type N-terminal cleavage/methylation domain-containing protein